MYQNMLQNTATLPTRIWGRAQADFAQLARLTLQGQSLAYSMSNIDDVFRQRFGTYDFFRGQNITGPHSVKPIRLGRPPNAIPSPAP